MMSIKNLSVRQKLLILPMTSAAMFFGLSLLVINSLSHDNDLIVHLERENLSKLTTLSDLFLKLSSNHTDLVSLLMTTYDQFDEEQIQTNGKQNLYLIQQLYDKTQSLKALSSNENESRQIDRLLLQIKEYQSEAISSVEMASVDLALAKKFMIRANRSHNKVNNDLLGLLKTSRNQTVNLIGKSRYVSGRNLGIFIHFGLVAMLGLIAIGILASFRLSREVKARINLMTRLTKGDVSTEIPTDDRKDEIGDLSRGIAAFKVSLVEEARAKENAQTANKAKSEFLAKMSHEFRTPLHGILSFARFGVVKANTAKPEKLREYFEKIEESGRILLQLVNDVLDLAKLEAGKVELNIQPGHIKTTIEVVADEFISLLSSHDLTLRCQLSDEECEVEFDELRMMQVIRNLLSNAVKFSPSDGVIELSLTYMDDAAVICVRDSGPGIPEGELESIFNKFEQSSQNAMTSGGTGLGLSICREIVAGHKGRIWADNNSQGGATFFVELPRHHDEVDSVPAAMVERLVAQA